MTRNKFNPFMPNNITNPGMFVGRVEELRTIERSLFQAKNGNPLHFLVQGERGIGKSSLLHFVELTAEGKITPILGERFNFLTVSIDLGGCQSQSDIIRKVGRGLKQALGERQALLDAAKGFWDWLTNWEILGVQYHKNRGEFDVEEVAEELVAQLSSFCSQTSGRLDGILILIDEADRPNASAGLGEFLKLTSERLSRRGCNTVLFGVAGLPTIISKLRESHDSSPRLFHTMLLEPLEMEERRRVVRIGINVANDKNDTPTQIDPAALTFLAELSEGYPHFVQQFAFSAFEHDSDDTIDEEDVGEGAFKEGGALSQLGDKFFNEMYHARISSEDYRRVLDAMAEYGDRWVSRRVIITESAVSEHNVNNALQTLKAKEIIIQDDTRRGFYRLPTNSFAAWINAIRSARARSDALQGDQFSG